MYGDLASMLEYQHGSYILSVHDSIRAVQHLRQCFTPRDQSLFQCCSFTTAVIVTNYGSFGPIGILIGCISRRIGSGDTDKLTQSTTQPGLDAKG